MFLSLAGRPARKLLLATCLLCLTGTQHAHAQANPYQGALTAYQTQNFSQAEQLWLALAEQGDANAQYALGVMHLRNEAANASRTRALEYFSLAAAQGHATAMFNVGVAYWEGSGVAQDRDRALEWWERAARGGDSGAQFNLGLASYIGEGKPRDLATAAKWIGMAAEQNHPEARRIMAMIAEENPELAATNSRSADSIAAAGAVTANPQPETLSQDVQTASTAPTNSIAATMAGNTAATSSTGTVQGQREYWRTAGGTTALHADAADQSPIIFSLPEGTPVDVVTRVPGWAMVTLPAGLKLWIFNKFLTVDGNQGTVTGTDVRARPQPSTDNSTAPPIGVYRQGDSVAVLAQQGSWYQVRAPRRLGAWTREENILSYRDTPQGRNQLWQAMVARGL